MASGVRQLFRLPAAKPRQPLKKTQNPLDRVGPLLKFKWLVASVAATGKRRLKPSVTYIGVTGSCGKTTTTQLTGEVLSAAGRCFVNTDRNGPEGLSRSMLSMRSGFEYAIHELCGAWPGRIRQQTRILKPQIGVVTTVGSDHFKVYRTLEATAKEKGVLAEALPQQGWLILNADDPLVRAMAQRTRARVITYGLSADADVRGSDVTSKWPDRLAVTITHGNESLRVASRLVGNFG
ncbi:MAG TPA: Mur ligase family protein [Methyloceanibacter sp.]|nr:Mur ligase family protein [Methyloceanibacter sp.]